MLKKEDLIKIYKENYKPAFLLAWARYLTYKELQQTDNLEAYLSEKFAKRVKKIADWNDNVLEYNEENIKRTFCIALYDAIRNVESETDFLNFTYIDDIKTWLNILEDPDFQYLSDEMSVSELLDTYNKISNKYKFNL